MKIGTFTAHKWGHKPCTYRRSMRYDCADWLTGIVVCVGTLREWEEGGVIHNTRPDGIAD